MAAYFSMSESGEHLTKWERQGTNPVCVIWFSLDEKSTTGKSIETEYKFLATKSASDWKKRGIIAHVEFLMADDKVL